MRLSMRLPLILSVLIALTMTNDLAQADVSFRDKSITMLVGAPPGGGTDIAGRAIARFLGKYLPGNPNIIVQNMPGANGITAMNHFARQTKPDGLTVIMGSVSILDPVTSRNANAQYDLRTVRMAGGLGRGGSIFFISKTGEARLHDKSLPPAIIGNVGALPRAGLQPAVWSIEYLGWNAKWVAGYPGTDQLMLALDRGEVDMGSTGNILLIKDRMDHGRVNVVFQTSSIEGGKIVGRPDFGNAPTFLEQMQGKITDPIAQKAFDYWMALSSVDKWLALAPGTPDDILAAYREAFRKFSIDQDFLELGDKISDGMEAIEGSDVENFAKILAETPTEALGYVTELMRRQGLRVQ